jgi:hypothetical protein
LSGIGDGGGGKKQRAHALQWHHTVAEVGPAALSHGIDLTFIGGRRLRGLAGSVQAGVQQDSHELLRLLLDGLHGEQVKAARARARGGRPEPEKVPQPPSHGKRLRPSRLQALAKFGTDGKVPGCSPVRSTTIIV